MHIIIIILRINIPLYNNGFISSFQAKERWEAKSNM